MYSFRRKRQGKKGTQMSPQKSSLKKKKFKLWEIKVAKNFPTLFSEKKTSFIFDPPKLLKVKTFLNLFQYFR